MHKKTGWFITICLTCSISLFSNDTLLTRVFSYEEVVRSLSHDKKGNIYATFSSGMFRIDLNSGEPVLVNSRFNQELFFSDSLCLLTPPLDSRFYDTVKAQREKNLVWLKHLPPSHLQSVISVGVDSMENYYIAASQHIYKFRIIKSIQKVLPIYSVRGIARWQGSIYYNTYSGLFKDGECLDPEILGGDLYQNPKGDLFVSSGRYVFQITTDEVIPIDFGTSLFDWLTAKSRNIIQIMQAPQGDWLLGTDKGLAVINKDTNLYLLPKLSIEEIRTSKEGYFLSTSKGMFILKNNYRLIPLKLPPLYYNQSVSHGSILFLATDEGLYSFNSSNESLSPLLTNKEGKKALGVYTLLKDDRGFLWCGTSEGLFQIDLSNPSFKTKHLDNIEFNKRSFFQDDKAFYMGAISGVYRWQPIDFAPKIATNIVGQASHIPTHTIAANRKPWIIAALVALVTIIAIYQSRHLFRNKGLPIDPLLSPLEDTEAPELHLPSKEQLDAFIEEHINAITVHLLCTHFDLKKTDLYKATKRLYRKTPGQLIREKRQELILSTRQANPNISIKDLAEIVGYSERHIQNVLDKFSESTPFIQDKTVKPSEKKKKNKVSDG